MLDAYRDLIDDLLAHHRTFGRCSMRLAGRTLA